MTKSLWTAWPFLERQLAATSNMVVVLDYDGTLTPVVDHPSKARLPTAMKVLLEPLARRPGIRVALVSGRCSSDLKRLVDVPGLYYVGNHGLELRGPGLRYVNQVARANRPLLRRIANELKITLRLIPGAWVEEKGLTLSVHWRNVPQAASPRFRRLVARCMAPYLKQGAIRVTRGKRVIEIRPPVDWDKGAGVTWLLRRLAGRSGLRRTAVMCIGDDRTDEDAFAVVNRVGGISVSVGSRARRTVAKYSLKDVAEVGAWLRVLLETWKRPREDRSRWTGHRSCLNR